MKKITFLFVLLFSLTISQKLWCGFPRFTLHKIGTTGQMMLGQSSLVDLDGDGDLDLIVGASGSTIWWFEYVSPNKWVKHVLGEDALTDQGDVAVDVDGDGLIDQVSGGSWYKNPGNKSKEWTRFEYGGIYAYDQIAADVNGDGKPEIISMSPQEGIYVYFINSNPEKKWKKVKVGKGVYGGIAPRGAGDIDGDGDIDIVRSNEWFENVKGDGTKWRAHRTLQFVGSEGDYPNSSRVYVVDMDGDKDMDVVETDDNNSSGKIAWLENKDGKGVNWFTHPIDQDTKQDLHALCVADFDNDGDLDIFSGGGPMTGDAYKRCFIWENADGKGTKWIRHQILTKVECYDAVAADVDGDGDIDICFTPWKSDTVYYLQNMLMEDKKK